MQVNAPTQQPSARTIYEMMVYLCLVEAGRELRSLRLQGHNEDGARRVIFSSLFILIKQLP